MCEKTFAWSNWTEDEKKLFVASNIAMIADWTTTRYASRNFHNLPGTYEKNKILGKYPTTKEVDVYFLFLLASNYYIANYFESNYRGFYLFVRTTTHGYAAMNNVELGWKLRF